MSREIIDISPLIKSSLAVWPGDVAYTRDIALDMKTGANLTLSSIRTTLHIGAHADAPNHYIQSGASIAETPLDAYLGPCFVLHAKTPRGGLISGQDALRGVKLAKKNGAQRLIFRTDSYPNPEVFNEDFAAFSPEAVTVMGEAGVVLIGIDTPSVDPFHSKELPAHHLLHRYQIRNLEGLILNHVEEGVYELIALPLRLDACDASPVRAVLIK